MRYLLVLLGLLVTSTVQAIDCQKVPDCTELGYSQTENENCAEGGYIYCPFDKSYKKCVNMDCEKLGFTKEDKTSWCGKIVSCRADKTYTACKALCEVGDVFYADGTCGYAEDYDKSKVPAGIVFYVTDSGRHGKVIALHDLCWGEDFLFHPEMPFSGKYPDMKFGYYHYELPIKNWGYTSETTDALKRRDFDLYDGKGNTNKILATHPSCDYTSGSKDYALYCIPSAALATHQFYPPHTNPDNSVVGQGHWYLPALGELMDLYGYDNANIAYFYGDSGATGKIKAKVNQTLDILKKKNWIAEQLTDNYYLSSTEYDQDRMWDLIMSSGARNCNSKIDERNKYVRPILEF